MERMKVPTPSPQQQNSHSPTLPPSTRGHGREPRALTRPQTCPGLGLRLSASRTLRSFCLHESPALQESGNQGLSQQHKALDTGHCRDHSLPIIKDCHSSTRNSAQATAETTACPGPPSQLPTATAETTDCPGPPSQQPMTRRTGSANAHAPARHGEELKGIKPTPSRAPQGPLPHELHTSPPDWEQPGRDPS